jgi:hypothetical protein
MIGQRLSNGLLCSTKAFVSSNTKRIRLQGLSNLAWLFAMLEYNFPIFFPVIAAESLQRFEDFALEDKVVLVLAYRELAPHFWSSSQIASSTLSYLSKYMALDIFNVVYGDCRHNLGTHVNRLSNTGPTNFPLGWMHCLV